MRRAAWALVFVLGACTNRVGEGDTPADPTANPLGNGTRVRDVQNPANGNAGKTFDMTAVTVLAVDQYDETGDGKSRGTIWVQDFGSTDPFSGVSLYSPVLVPASLRLAPGDVVDLSGQYAEVTALGTNRFAAGTFLPQIVTPTTKLRFEGPVPTPKEIDLDDLNKFETGRRWIGMLVVVKDVYAATAVILDPASNRGSVTLTKNGGGGPVTSASAPTISNELTPLTADTVSKGAKLASVTGVVTFFATSRAINFHIAPRNGADIKIQP
ncbi:MAG: hypothetical protein U0235_25015 [Polyangiaceae bacterium]